MLISRRREGETVRIGDAVEVRIVSVRKKKVILGIIAPRDVRITAAKLTDAELATTMAAANSIELADLLHTAHPAGEQVVFLLDDSAKRTESRSPKVDKNPGEPA